MATDRMPPTDLLDQLAAADVDVLRTILEHTLQRLIEAEATAYIGAEPGEHSASRTTYRNGHRPRMLDTRVGRMDLHRSRRSAPAASSRVESSGRCSRSSRRRMSMASAPARWTTWWQP